MRIDMTEVKEGLNYLKAGKHTVKVVKQEETYSTNGKQLLKVTMEDKNGFIITDDFYLGESSLWKLKIFTKALKMPNVIDTAMMLNRYVVIDVVDEAYQDKQGNNKSITKVKSYEESSLTNTLVQEDVVFSVPVKVVHYSGVPDIDIDSDEIPFNGGK